MRIIKTNANIFSFLYYFTYIYHVVSCHSSHILAFEVNPTIYSFKSDIKNPSMCISLHTAAPTSLFQRSSPLRNCQDVPVPLIRKYIVADFTLQTKRKANKSYQLPKGLAVSFLFLTFTPTLASCQLVWASVPIEFGSAFVSIFP